MGLVINIKFRHGMQQVYAKKAKGSAELPCSSIDLNGGRSKSCYIWHTEMKMTSVGGVSSVLIISSVCSWRGWSQAVGTSQNRMRGRTQEKKPSPCVMHREKLFSGRGVAPYYQFNMFGRCIKSYKKQSEKMRLASFTSHSKNLQTWFACKLCFMSLGSL